MSGAIYQAGAGALVQQLRMEMIANNLANANTTGFKADNPIFRLPVEEIKKDIDKIGSFVPDISPPLEAITDFSSGALIKTANPLDVAIVGRGFFEVQTGEGPKFSRNGSFTINPNGMLSTAQGYPVMGQSGEIAIDGRNVEIGGQGEVYVDGELVDAIKIVDFEDKYTLKKSGDSFFIPDESGLEIVLDEGFQVAQGFIENSNVNTIRSMTDMIETMRIYEAYQKVIQSADAATEKTVTEIATTA